MKEMKNLIESQSVDPRINISVIIRTMGRPEVLQEAIESLDKQTYKDFEVVVVEDGKDLSKSMLDSYTHLKVQYHSTGAKTSRAKAGNIGLSIAKGKYLIFLDDDDMFFPNHLEVLVRSLQENPTYAAVYSIAYEVPTRIYSLSPYKYKEKKAYIRYAQPFNHLLIFYQNYIPIQTILFKRELYEKYGEFDETMVLEDWDLWMRYSLENEFLFIPQVTSKYRVPSRKKDYSRRSEEFNNSIDAMRIKQKEINYSANAYEFYKDIDGCIEFYRKDVARTIVETAIRDPAKIFKMVRRLFD